MHRVRNVAMHEYITRLAVADGCLRNTRIGAAYPEDFGSLALCEIAEGVGVRGGGGGDVVPVAGEEVVEGV